MCVLCNDWAKKLTIKEKLNAFNELVHTDDIDEQHLSDVYKKIVKEQEEELKMNNCPHCNSSLIGDPIPTEDREFFGNRTNFRREIGIEYPEKYDGVWEWMCPDCKGKWDSEVKKLK